MIHKLKHIHTSNTLTCPPSFYKVDSARHLRHIALFLSAYVLRAVFCSIGEKVLFVNVSARGYFTSIVQPLYHLALACSRRVTALRGLCLFAREHNRNARKVVGSRQ